MNDQLPPIADSSSRLAASRKAFEALRPRVEARAPWPLAERFDAAPEAAWGPREALAHVAEMLPYWLGEYERLVEAGRGPGDGQPFGRLATDTLRLGVLERDRTLPLRELFDRIDSSIARWERRAAQAAERPADDVAAGLHPRLGEMTAGEVRDRFVVGHLEEHVEQLEALLGATPAAGAGG